MNEEIVMHLSSAADRWERTHPIIGFGELRVHDALRDAVRCIKETSAKVPRWISVEERLPEPEQRVLLLTEEKVTRYAKWRGVTCGFYEDGNVWSEDSKASWDHCMLVDYDEERDDFRVPEGWIEEGIAERDDYNCAVISNRITHWMPLPEPLWEEPMDIRPIDDNALLAKLGNERRITEYDEAEYVMTYHAVPTLKIDDAPTLSLNTLRDEIYEDAVAHGLFEEFDKITDPVRQRRKLAMRIMEEAAEMYAAADDPEHYAEEAADVTLMTGDVCGYLNIDWHGAVMAKKEYNKTRPWKHGKE